MTARSDFFSDEGLRALLLTPAQEDGAVAGGGTGALSAQESAFWEASEAARLDLLAKVREGLRACGFDAGAGEQLGGAGPEAFSPVSSASRPGDERSGL